MSDVKMEITPDSQRQFNRHIDDMVKATGADIEKVIRNTGRDFLRLAVSNTPLSKPNVMLYERIERRDGSTYFKPMGKI